MGRLASRGGQDLGSFESVRDALAHGTIIASFNVESFSLERMQSISRKDVHDRYDQYAAMMRFSE